MAVAYGAPCWQACVRRLPLEHAAGAAPRPKIALWRVHDHGGRVGPIGMVVPGARLALLSS